MHGVLHVDLRATKSVGFKAGYVPRPLERDPNVKRDLTPDPSFEVVAKTS